MPSIEEALLILKNHYGKNDPKISWILDGPIRQVWKVGEGTQYYILKSIPNQKPPLPILLQQQLSKQINVPAVTETKDKKMYVQTKTHYFFLAEFIEQSEEGLTIDRVRMIAEFHQKVVFPSSLLAYQDQLMFNNTRENWLQDYKDKIKLLKKWIEQYKIVDDFQVCFDMAEASMNLFKKYRGLEEHLKLIKDKRILCHGDFNTGNMIKTSGGKCYIIDFDASKIDSPIKDMRLILPGILFESLYKDYFSIYPKGKKFEELYYIDALFPHIIWKKMHTLVRKKLLHEKRELIKELIVCEAEKQKILKKLL